MEFDDNPKFHNISTADFYLTEQTDARRFGRTLESDEDELISKNRKTGKTFTSANTLQRSHITNQGNAVKLTNENLHVLEADEQLRIETSNITDKFSIDLN